MTIPHGSPHHPSANDRIASPTFALRPQGVHTTATRLFHEVTISAEYTRWLVCTSTGSGTDRHAMAVSGLWRITFRWDGKDAHDLDLEQYH
jgi:hypothetical protein